MEKWLTRDRLSRKIIIQQDGEKTIFVMHDKDFKGTLMEKGTNAKLYKQAANSPDVKLLYLGFFRAIQSFNDATPKKQEELIQALSINRKISMIFPLVSCCSCVNSHSSS